MASKLSKIGIEEVSGVDKPANQIPGWLMTKAVGDALAAVEADKPVTEDVNAEGKALTKRLVAFLKGADPKEDLEMDKTELAAILDERDANITKAITEGVAALLKASTDEAAAEAERVAKAEADAAAATAEAEQVKKDAAVAAAAAAEAEAGKGETVEYASAADVASLTERIDAVADALAKSADAVQALLKRSAPSTALVDVSTEGEKVEKTAGEKMSGVFTFAAKNPGKTIELVG